MEIEKFKRSLETNGLSRTNQWVCRIYAPPALSQQAAAVFNSSVNIGGNKINMNLPALDILTAEPATMLNTQIGDFPISTELNYSMPTLGYLLTGNGDFVDSLSLYVESCELPSRDILNFEVREHGEARSHGIRHTHGDLVVSYYLSESLMERQFFEIWQDGIFNPQTKNTAYYNTYVGTMEIHKYNASWETREAVYRFNEVYPTNIGKVTLNQQGEVAKCDIIFKYRNFERIE